MAKEIHLVLKGGHTQYARLDKTEAKEIIKLFKSLGDSEVFGLPPSDSSHLIPWWSNKVSPELRWSVQTVKLKDVLER